jgi:predicted ATP-grasp superfamily ATP-dependent carboligase
MTPASFSRYSVSSFRYPSPDAEPEAFLDTVEKVVADNRPEDRNTPYVLMPIHKETYALSRHRRRFEEMIRLPVPDIAHIEKVHDKGSLAEYAMGLGLSIPRTWLPRSAEELEEMAREIPVPAFVKLRTSAAGVGIAMVRSTEEMVSTWNDFVHRYEVGAGALPLAQEAVPGDDYCVTTLFDHGQLRACMTYRSLRGFPADKGASVLRETVAAPQMERVSADLLGRLGWHGVAEIDFRWDGDPASPPRLIEVNPRFWGGLTQAIESGWDYPWLLFRLAVDGHVDPPDATRLDVRTETPLLGVLATLQEIADNDTRLQDLRQAWQQARTEVRTGSKRAAMRGIASGLDRFIDAKGRARELKRHLEVHQDTVFDVLSSRDPLPALGVLYPLAVFLKHGRVNLELLTSEGGPGPGPDE